MFSGRAHRDEVSTSYQGVRDVSMFVPRSGQVSPLQSCCSSPIGVWEQVTEPHSREGSRALCPGLVFDSHEHKQLAVAGGCHAGQGRPGETSMLGLRY